MPNGKALIFAVTDLPSENSGNFTFDVGFFVNNAPYRGVYQVSLMVNLDDSIAQIKTKIRDAIIAKGAELGISISGTNIGSIFQI